MITMTAKEVKRDAKGHDENIGISLNSRRRNDETGKQMMMKIKRHDETYLSLVIALVSTPFSRCKANGMTFVKRLAYLPPSYDLL